MRDSDLNTLIIDNNTTRSSEISKDLLILVLITNMTYEHQTQKQELENEEQARQLESLTDRLYLAVFQPFIPE